jgi:hypothetical protein
LRRANSARRRLTQVASLRRDRAAKEQ